jgi:hypothetical protein
VTGVQRIIHVTRRIIFCKLHCSLGVTGGIHFVTGGVPIGSLGLFMRLIGVFLALIGVIGRFETARPVLQR